MNNMNIQEEEYVTLFCEGDGGIRITDTGYPRVDFYQKERDVLDFIDSLTENGHFYRQRDDTWVLEFNGSYCIPLLEIFSRHVVSKSFLDRLNEVLEHVDMPLAVQRPLTLEGFIAFWDAEGSSSNAPTISVSQKDREILDLITEMLDGSVTLQSNNVHQWQLSGNRARELCEVILEKSHCPKKRECLCKNFEGPNYYELHKDERKVYNDAYHDTHKAEQKVRDSTRWKKQKAIREWMKAHPEAVKELEAKR